MESNKTQKIPKNLHWVKCFSSQIKEVAHKEKTKTLYIRFNRGGTYSYYPCTDEIFDKLNEAESTGSWFHKHIRNNPKYKIIKLQE